MAEKEPEIGTPRLPVSKWLEEFAIDNDAAASESFWPWTRARLRGRAAAYRSAALMVRNAYEGNTSFPITLQPQESVTFLITGSFEPKGKP